MVKKLKKIISLLLIVILLFNNKMFVKANDNVTPIEIKNGIEMVSIKSFIENSGGTLEIQEEGNTVIYKIMDKELVIKNNLSHGYINGKVVPFTYEVIKENNNELIFPDFSFDIQLIENDCLLPLQFIEKNFNVKKVETMEGMFKNCENLKTIDLSSFTFNETLKYNLIFKNINPNSIIYVKSSIEQAWIFGLNIYIRPGTWTIKNIIVK